MWALLTSRLAGPIASAVAVALACFLLAVSIQNAGLKSKVAKQAVQIGNLQVDLRQCRANEDELEGAIATQNAAIRQAGADAKKRDDAARKAVRVAEQASREAERRAGRILAARPGEDVCASADALILETVR